MKTDTVTQTVRIKLRDPTNTKEERIQHAIDEAGRITPKIAELMQSIPPTRWGDGKNDSVYFKWVKQHFPDQELRAHDAYEVAYKVGSSFASWYSNGRTGEIPRFDDVDWIRFRDPQDSTYYDKEDGKWRVKLPVQPRNPVWVPLLVGPYQEEVLEGIASGKYKEGSMELHRQNGDYYVHQTYSREVELPEQDKVQHVAGVDIGVNNIAVLAVKDAETGEIAEVDFHTGGEMIHYWNRIHRKRKELQEKGLVDKLEELKQQEHLYVENQLHTVSRRIVDTVAQYDSPVIVLEDLDGYRDTLIEQEKEYTNAQRRILHRWPFRELQLMIEYKAREEGILLRYIDPRNTSRRCNKCGEIGHRDGDDFYCEECDYEVNADYNGAANIIFRAQNQSE